MSGYVNPMFRPDFTGDVAPPVNRLASGFNAIWPASNPVGTETTQGMQSATPTDQIAFMRPDGTPVMASDLAAAHQQVQTAMQTAPTMVLGMMGATASGKMAPIEVSGGYVKGQSNIVRFREDADAIQSALPPVPEGHTRLWRGNRADEVGTNQQFTSDLPGIALPFRESYGGPVSYVDVPTAVVENHLQRDFAAPGVEYWLPPDIAKQAQPVHVTPRVTPGARSSMQQQSR